MCDFQISRARHAYLLVKDGKSYLYSNLKLAKQKYKELGGCKVYEWMEVTGIDWCDPIDSDTLEFIRDGNHEAWQMLRVSEWNATKLKYPFNDRNCNNCGNKDCFSQKESPETYHTSPPCTGWIRI